LTRAFYNYAAPTVLRRPVFHSFFRHSDRNLKKLRELVRGTLTWFSRLVTLKTGGAVTRVQLVVFTFVFCNSENALEGMIHETTALPPAGAMRIFGGTVICALKMLPCWTTVANRPPSADEHNEV
jgi:hypothetical protein